MVRSHPEMVQFLFLKRNSKMHPVSIVSVPSCALYNHIGAIASKINGFKDLLFWQIFLSPIHDLWIFIATLWLVELHGLATLWLVEIWCNPPEIGSQSRVKQFRKRQNPKQHRSLKAGKMISATLSPTTLFQTTVAAINNDIDNKWLIKR